jgi:hypothetical protein
MNETFWYTGEPKGGQQQCATINVEPGVVSATAMRDIACDEMFNYICEVRQGSNNNYITFDIIF